jgi:hypothetical protein
VSYTGLEDDVKRKVYKHQNWYLTKVKIIQVPGFRNIDHKYEIGMNKTWSFREFMHEQPNSSMKVPIDVDKGGFKIRGTKIMVMPGHVKEAQRAYKEFRTLTNETMAEAGRKNIKTKMEGMKSRTN